MSRACRGQRVSIVMHASRQAVDRRKSEQAPARDESLLESINAGYLAASIAKNRLDSHHGRICQLEDGANLTNEAAIVVAQLGRVAGQDLGTARFVQDAELL